MHEFIPFGRPSFGDAEIEAVSRVLRSGWVGMGPETLAFEKELAQFIGAADVVTVNACTSGLFLSLLLHEVGPGADVVCPSLTWCSTANVALMLGARPVFCDIDGASFNMTPETVAAALTPATKAVIVVHFGGLAVDVDAIRAVLPAGVALIEDAAHALGGAYPDGRSVGNAGNLACFSFYANKVLSTADGGAVAVHDPEVAARFRSLRQHAMTATAWTRFQRPDQRYGMNLQELGYKLHYNDLLASIGRVQLARQRELHARRHRIATSYAALVADFADLIEAQQGAAEPRHAHHLFSVKVKGGRDARDALMDALRGRGVGATIHYAPLHAMDLYGWDRPLPVTEEVADGILTLPIGNDLPDDALAYILDQLHEVLTRRR